ncbi:MAG: hybrid sensor histidine kinase/response regulator [Deltaproteobacteria bacterium]|nr:MAG: hybrid sensor histidine kinase/response regulator [Deltaproteobacteria bacterium]
MALIEDQTYQPKILVIDDEKRIRDGCFKILIKENCLVEMAESGEMGLKMLAEKHYDIILTDLMMPGIGGMEVLAKVREQHPDSVSIVITGFATLEHSIEAMKKGAFDFIPKPFTPDQLRVVVSKAVKMTRTLQDIATERTRLKTIVNYLAGGVLVTDRSKNIILYNPALLRMLGYEGDALDDQPLSALTADEKLTGIIDGILELNIGEFKVLSAEIEPHGKGEGPSNQLYLRAQAVPFQNRSGEILGSVTIIDDITHLKELDEMKSAFVSMVSHEIRSPLSTVLSQIKILMDGLAGELGAKQADILGKISRKVQGLVELSNELLDISRIEAGLIVQDKKQVQLMDILESLVEFIQPRAKEKNIALSLKKADIPLINADIKSMEEVFSNLITNAIIYTPEGGEVTVEGEVKGDFVGIIVSDTGYGIAPDEIPRIFERFYRAKTEKTRNIVGTGLGLPIVKSIVESHNGTVKVESKEGVGSTFYVRLPIS